MSNTKHSKTKVNHPFKTEENGRDNKGRFKEGAKGGPGRPKGISITEAVRDRLGQVPEGQQITYLEAILRKILKKAISDEDGSMITKIWNYIDGMPKQAIEHSGEIEEKIELDSTTKAAIQKFVELEKKKIK
jgi:hypothetical protein